MRLPRYRYAPEEKQPRFPHTPPRSFIAGTPEGRQQARNAATPPSPEPLPAGSRMPPSGAASRFWQRGVFVRFGDFRRLREARRGPELGTRRLVTQPGSSAAAEPAQSRDSVISRSPEARGGRQTSP